MPLISHLGGDAGLVRGPGQLAAFVKGVSQRLLAVDVLAGADGRHRRDGVNVIGRADRDGVDLLRFLVDHLPEIFVAPRLGECVKRAGGALVVDVAQGDDVGSEPGDGGDVASSHAAGTDSADIDSLARRDEARPAQHVARDDHEVEGEPAGRGQERATRRTGTLVRLFELARHGCSFSRDEAIEFSTCERRTGTIASARWSVHGAGFAVFSVGARPAATQSIP